MEARTHQRVDIAIAQLETAIRLYLVGEDYFSVITLAGAAEEIFGRILQLSGKVPSLHRYAESYSLCAEVILDKKISPAAVLKERNTARNAIKHLNDWGSLNVVLDAPYEAKHMVCRALENYKALNLRPSPIMERFEYMDELQENEV